MLDLSRRRALTAGLSGLSGLALLPGCAGPSLPLMGDAAAMGVGAGAAPAPDYAESVALVAMSEDLSHEIALRLARFPAAGAGTLWAYGFGEGIEVGFNDRLALSSPRLASAVTAPDLAYEEKGLVDARLARKGFATPGFAGDARVAVKGHEGGHPPNGPGAVPLGIEARFNAFHTPQHVDEGRTEVFGLVQARIRAKGGDVLFEAPGKWHEQSGPRPSFAPAFTYMAIMSRAAALLSVWSEDLDYGFAWRGGEVTQVVKAEFDPPGPAERRFTAHLADGSTVSGLTRKVRETSVAIEGKRRPSATVRAVCDLGPLVGNLNDWVPPAA